MVVAAPHLDELVGHWLGVPPQVMQRAKLRPVSLEHDGQRILLHMAGPEDLRFSVEMAPRDDAQPAFLRTAHLNFGWRGDRKLPAIERLIERMAGQLAQAQFATLREAASSCAPTNTDPVSPAVPAVAPRPTTPAPVAPPQPVRPEGAFAVDARLFEVLSGDIPCGMMGAVAVIDGVGFDLAFLIHGDHSCTPPPQVSGLRIYNSCMTDIDVVYGGEERLLAAVEWIAASRNKPEALLLLGTCLSQMIGEDLTHLAELAERATGIAVVPLRTDGLKRLRPVVVAAQVHDALAARFIQPSDAPKRGVGLVGFSDPGVGFLPELRRVIARAGLEVAGMWPQDGLKGLASLAHAQTVLAPELAVYGPLLARLTARCGTPVQEHRVPYGLAGSASFYARLGQLGGRTLEVQAAVAELTERAAARLARFRSRFGGQRVTVGFGNNHKGTAGSTTVHLGLGFVPLLLEAGLEPVLVAQGEPGEALHAQVATLAARLGAAAEVYVHADPDGQVPILRRLQPALAITDHAQKDPVDASGVPFVDNRTLEPGLGGLCRTLDVLEGTLS